MIISASRRTDIPAFYSDWFIEQIKSGNCYVNGEEISLKPEDVDCIVFWTKNANPLFQKLDNLLSHKFYFQYTITGYGKDIEPNLNKEEAINTFINLSNLIGKEKVIWRYDPILLTDNYNVIYHLNKFNELCYKLHPYTEKVIISFIDVYPKLIQRLKSNSIILQDPFGYNYEPAKCLTEEMIRIARSFNLKVESCAEFLKVEGLEKSHCIDKNLIERITGKELNVEKDPTQRNLCGCCFSIDIGGYNTCKHGCKYCYACS